MFAFLKELLTPPTFDNPTENGLAKQLHYMLLLGTPVSTSFSVLVLILTDDLSGAILSASMTIVTIGLFFLLKRRRQLRFVSRSIIFSSYISVMFAIFTNGGIRDQALVILVMILTWSGVYLGGRPTVR